MNEDINLCPDCGCELEEVRFLEEEEKVDSFSAHVLYKTGRIRSAVDYLVCPFCLRRFCVDADYHAGPWREKKEDTKERKDDP